MRTHRIAHLDDIDLPTFGASPTEPYSSRVHALAGERDAAP